MNATPGSQDATASTKSIRRTRTSTSAQKLIVAATAWLVFTELPGLAQQPESPVEHPARTASAVRRPATLEELMITMAETSGVVAHFTEIKHLALLESPLETRGTLYFIPPNRMARHTTSPGKSSFIIDGDLLLFDDEAGGDEIDLGANPIARVFVENFIVLFNGDLGELRQRYDPVFETTGDSWSLRLKPHRAPLSTMIASITMQGDDGGMKSMVLREVGGDVTETTFDSVDSTHRFSVDEIKRIFRAEIPAP